MRVVIYFANASRILSTELPCLSTSSLNRADDPTKLLGLAHFPILGNTDAGSVPRTLLGQVICHWFLRCNRKRAVANRFR